jgi:hypothetical protein
MVTVFAHIKETKQPFYRNINDVLNDIKSGSNKEYIEKIRSVKDKDKN